MKISKVEVSYKETLSVNYNSTSFGMTATVDLEEGEGISDVRPVVLEVVEKVRKTANQTIEYYKRENVLARNREARAANDAVGVDEEPAEEVEV